MKRLPHPFSEVPDAPDIDEHQGELTPITDLPAAFRKISQISKTTQALMGSIERQEKVISLIPAIKMQVDDARGKAEQARVAANEARNDAVISRTLQEGLKDRLERMEMNGHLCVRGPEIEQLKIEASESRKDQSLGVQTRQLVDSIDESLEEVKVGLKSVEGNKYKSLLGFLAGSVGVVITIIGAAWVLSWQLSGLSRDLVAEQNLRVEQTSTLKARLDGLPTKKQVDEIGVTVHKSSQAYPIVERCTMLSRSERDHLEQEIRKGRLPEEFRCPR